MKITENTVVTLEYVLHLGDGVTVDRSEPDDPLVYLHGSGEIVPGLEEALEGLEPGQSRQVVVPPAEGYGEREDAAVQEIDSSAFEGRTVSAGDTLVATDEDGDEMLVTVVKVEGDKVTIDLNHPLAGKSLHFDVKVREVRAATPEELEHGHVHGPEGHEH